MNPGCFKFNSGINLSPFNKNLLMVLFILNVQMSLKLRSSLFLIKVHLFLPQIAQFDKSITLLYLVFMALEFLFAVYFLQLTQYVSLVFI